MIIETALRVAGPGSMLVSRPTGVAHVYVGPLTPSGRCVPRSRRTVCRARTRRLAVHAIGSTLDVRVPVLHRLCARCSACLGAGVGARQVEPLPRTRDDYRRVYAATSQYGLVIAARMADTPDELDQVAHLTIVLWGHAGCLQPVTRRDGRTSASLHTHIAWHRQRVLGFPDQQAADEYARQASEGTRSRKKEAREAREQNIKRLGFINATR